MCFPRKGSRWMVGAHPVRRYQRWYCRLYRSASSWEHRLCDTRAALGDLASSGYIDMARSCGMTRTQAVLRVGLRLATPQLVSVIGLTFASMVTGVMVIENLFALPGIGNGLVTDVGNRDLIAVQSELFLLAAFFLTVGLVVDLFHRVLDPRLKTATAITEVTA